MSDILPLPIELQLGVCKINYYILPDGEPVFSYRGLGALVNKDSNVVSRFLDKIIKLNIYYNDEPLTIHKIKVKLANGGETKINGLTLNYCALFILNELEKGNKLAFSVYEQICNTSINNILITRLKEIFPLVQKYAIKVTKENKFKTLTNKSELNVVLNLIKKEKLNAEREVLTPLGKIDILTESELIEVKVFKDYKSAIGQLLCYGKFYPNHKLRLHLFNKSSDKLLSEIYSICNTFNIKVTLD